MHYAHAQPRTPPGEVLKELIGDRTTLSRLLNGRAGISAPTALKLEAALSMSHTSPKCGITMQAYSNLY